MLADFDVTTDHAIAGCLPWPTPWAALFRRPGALLMEIGFGGGHFLVDLARQRPSANVLGVEISRPSLLRADKKRAHLGLTNVGLIQADATMALWALVAPQSLNDIYINFPDPWPKDRHHHRRLINDTFLHLAATRLTPGGRLNIATDHADYAGWIADYLVRCPYFDSLRETPFTNADPDRLVTKYERLGFEAGRSGHYFYWKRNEVRAPADFPSPPEWPMPHAIMHTTASLAQLAGAFTPRTITLEEVPIRLIDLYRGRADDELLIETNISERPFPQRVALAIRRRTSDELIVGLSPIGFPRPTRGVHLAVAQLAAWIQAIDPAAQLRHNGLQVALPPVPGQNQRP